jgi:hypothetical protein
VSQALTSVKAGLAELPVTAGNKVPPWVKVHLNTAGAKFDAVRFTNQYGFPGDLVLALVFPVETNMSWLIVPEGGHAWEDFGFVDFHQKHDLVIPELDLPAQNAAIFLQLEGAKITQAREFCSRLPSRTLRP